MGRPAFEMPFYRNLSNELYKGIVLYRPLTGNHIAEEQFREIARLCAGYIEDLVSGFGVWDAFRSYCRKNYNQILPFFSESDEEDGCVSGEVNLIDIKFLVWMGLHTGRKRQHSVYSPYTELIDIVAKSLYDLLPEIWETAPANDFRAHLIGKWVKNDDFFSFRELADWLVFSCYLTRVEGLEDKINAAKHGKDSEAWTHSDRVRAVLTNKLAPFGCHANGIVAEMAANTGNYALASRCQTVNSFGVAFYEVVGITESTIDLKCIARIDGDSPFVDEIKSVDKDSFSSLKELHPGTRVMAQLAQYGESVVLNGVMMVLGDESDESDTKIKAIAQDRGTPQITVEQLTLTKDHWAKIFAKNDGSQIFFPKSMRAFMEMQNEGLDAADFSSLDDSANGMTAYVFENGLTAFGNCPESFKSERNPYYDEAKASRPGMISVLIYECGLPSECLLEAAEEGMLSDLCINSSLGKEVGKAVVQDYLPFWINFLSSTTTTRQYDE